MIKCLRNVIYMICHERPIFLIQVILLLVNLVTKLNKETPQLFAQR